MFIVRLCTGCDICVESKGSSVFGDAIMSLASSVLLCEIIRVDCGITSFLVADAECTCRELASLTREPA